MAWVTKTSDEQYTPEPAPREYTKQEKAANWWHYNKIIVLVVIIIAAIVAWIVHDMMSHVDPDLEIGYVGAQSLPTDTVEALQDALTPYCTDRNGDGQVVVQVNQYTVSFDGEDDTTDPYNQMAGLTRLSADMAADSDMYMYLLADPEGFETDSEILQYLDGTVPADGEVGDWQKMVYRWTDCPVLAGLDLGNYTLYTDMEGSSQELLGTLYLGFRGNWDEEVPQSYTDNLAIWNALTAGAQSTVAEG